MTLILIRHGQTAFNIQRRFLGRTDLPLDDVGLSQAARLGDHLRNLHWDRLYSSPLLRARQTAEAIGVPTLCAGLTEMDMGDLEGLSREEMEARYPGLLSQWFEEPTRFRPPGGETLAEAQERAWAALQPLRGEGVRVVVTHQLVLAGILCRALDVPLGQFRKLSHGNTGITTLEDRGSDLQLVKLNDLGHLDQSSIAVASASNSAPGTT